MSESVADDREAAKERYNRVLNVVDAQTSSMQPDGIAIHTLVRLCRENLGLSRTEAHNAIRAACENGKLLKYRDQSGTVRYTRFTATTEAECIKTIESEREREVPNHAVVAAANSRLDELRGKR